MRVIASRVRSREEFVKLAFNEPKEAAKLLRMQADELEKSKKTTDILDTISETIFVSERQLFKDLKK